MKKSDRVSEKLVSPGLPGLQVATRLVIIETDVIFTVNQIAVSEKFMRWSREGVY